MDSRPYGLIALSASLLLGSFFLSGAIRDIRRGDDQLTVTGSARRAIRADFVIWRGSVSAQGATLAPASQELQHGIERVRAFLKEQGLADTAATFEPIQTHAIPELTGEGRETGRIIGYRLTQSFQVRSRDVDGITRLSQRTGDLIAQGIPIVASSPQYVFTGLADLRIALLADATRDARARAQAIAESAGGHVGPVRDAKMGVFQITPRFSTEVTDSGINDETAIDKDVTAVVRVTFALR
jgi:hypothetical protein